jgi:hypothetical protein
VEIQNVTQFIYEKSCSESLTRRGILADALTRQQLLTFSRRTRIARSNEALYCARQTGGNMRTRTIILTLALCFVGVAVVFAEDANMGTWKLNEAKSTFAAGATKNSTVVYEAAGDNVKVIVDGTDKDGKPTHNEWTGKFDGKDYPVTGDPNTDSRSLKKIDDRTLGLTAKKDGKVVSTGLIVVSADGETRTVGTSGTDSMGRMMKSSAVYDKQ